MTWAYVSDGSVVEERETLPENWQNHSNFFALESDRAFLRSLGWYKVIDDTKPIIDDFVEYHGAPQYQIDDESGLVIRSRPLLLKESYSTPDSILQLKRTQFMEFLRDRRDQLLASTDWTQVSDVLQSKSEKWATDWKAYRQSLRDLPAVYEKRPIDDLSDTNLIEWPTRPI